MQAACFKELGLDDLL